MTKTKKRRANLSTFQQDLHALALAHGAYQVPTPGPDTPAGIALNAAVVRYASDGFGRLRLGCPHAGPGQPAFLLLDEDVPRVRCLGCIMDSPPVLTADLDICRLCGTGSRRFSELIWLVAHDDLTVSINVCLLCSRDLG